MLFLFFLSLFVQASGVSIMLKPQKNLTNIKNMIGELADANPDDVASLYNNLQTMMNVAQAAAEQLQSDLDAAANAHGLAGVKHTTAVAAHAATLVSLQAAREVKEEADRKFSEAQGVTDAAQVEVDIALRDLEIAQQAHADAQNYFSTENPRLVNEISILQQMIVLHASLNSHKVIAGNPALIDGGFVCEDPTTDCTTGLVSDTEVHAVTCCSDTLITGWSKVCGDVYGERDVWAEGCQTLNWADANAFCLSKGGRLCTIEEISTSCLTGYGCRYDAWRVWTSSQ